MSDRPVAALMVTHYFETHRGGVEMVAGRLGRELADLDIRVTWAASDCDEPPADFPGRCVAMAAWNGTERRLGIPLPLWSPRALRMLSRLVKECDVVVLHDSLYPGNIAAALLARRHGKPVMVVQHIGLVPYRNPVFRGLMAVANRLVARRLLAAADQVVFISDLTRRYFATVPFRRPPVTIFNGVADHFRPASAEEKAAARRHFGLAASRPVALFVGRFVEKKGIDTVRRLAARHPDLHWLLVGWGPVEPEAWGLANVTVDRSRQGAAMATAYHAADLLVLPSVGEGFPLVVQEAMASGVTVLCGTDTAQADPRITDHLVHAAVMPGDPDATLAAWEPALRNALLRARTEGADLARIARELYGWRSAAATHANLMRHLA